MSKENYQNHFGKELSSEDVDEITMYLESVDTSTLSPLGEKLLQAAEVLLANSLSKDKLDTIARFLSGIHFAQESLRLTSYEDKLFRTAEALHREHLRRRAENI